MAATYGKKAILRFLGRQPFHNPFDSHVNLRQTLNPLNFTGMGLLPWNYNWRTPCIRRFSSK